MSLALLFYRQSICSSVCLCLSFVGPQCSSCQGRVHTKRVECLLIYVSNENALGAKVLTLGVHTKSVQRAAHRSGTSYVSTLVGRSSHWLIVPRRLHAKVQLFQLQHWAFFPLEMPESHQSFNADDQRHEARWSINLRLPIDFECNPDVRKFATRSV